MIISSCFPRQQIPALNDLLLLTGNDYAGHPRPFNEVRTKGFTDWISDVQRCWTLAVYIVCQHYVAWKLRIGRLNNRMFVFRIPPKTPKKPWWLGWTLLDVRVPFMAAPLHTDKSWVGPCWSHSALPVTSLCWWTRSCISQDGNYSEFYGFSYIPTGARFCPWTVCIIFLP